MNHRERLPPLFRQGSSVMVAYTLSAIRVEAFKLARSGDFEDLGSIEAALERRGYERARAAFRDPLIRARINGLCRDCSTMVHPAHAVFAGAAR
jgi:hypothetical protein